MNRYAISRRLFNRPLLLDHRAAASMSALALDGAEDVVEVEPRVYGLINRVAVIPVRGMLLQEPDWWFDSTCYGWIREGFQAAVLASDVDAIVLDVNSPGGEVAGCFDLVDEIHAARGTKPIWAILDEDAYSAAYAIASAADRVVVPRTGGVGSIGVMCMHVDISKMLSGAGVSVTFIQYGDRKTDGAAEKPLSDEARSHFQTVIDSMGDLFVETVARNRDLPVAKVRDTQAAVFLARDGVDLGLADAVMAPDAAFRELVGLIG